MDQMNILFLDKKIEASKKIEIIKNFTKEFPVKFYFAKNPTEAKEMIFAKNINLTLVNMDVKALNQKQERIGFLTELLLLHDKKVAVLSNQEKNILNIKNLNINSKDFLKNLKEIINYDIKKISFNQKNYSEIMHAKPIKVNNLSKLALLKATYRFYHKELKSSRAKENRKYAEQLIYKMKNISTAINQNKYDKNYKFTPSVKKTKHKSVFDRYKRKK